MTILLCSQWEPSGDWATALRDTNVTDVCVWPNVGDPGAVEVLITAGPLPKDLPDFPNLKLIQNLWAGVEALLRSPRLPADIPIIRMVDPGLTEGMREYVLTHVLRFHTLLPRFEQAQVKREWSPADPPLARERRIGILGLGVLGQAVAEALLALGFQVGGWSRTAKTLPGVTCYHGKDGLKALLRQSDILVGLLPHTPITDGLLNAERLSWLPEGACLINAGRGSLIVERDLLRALDGGTLAGAALDTFCTEPLPADHPFWSHPKITVTPHVASVTRLSTALPVVLQTIRHIQRGGRVEELAGLVDRERGY